MGSRWIVFLKPNQRFSSNLIPEQHFFLISQAAFFAYQESQNRTSPNFTSPEPHLNTFVLTDYRATLNRPNSVIVVILMSLVNQLCVTPFTDWFILCNPRPPRRKMLFSMTALYRTNANPQTAQNLIEAFQPPPQHKHTRWAAATLPPAALPSLSMETSAMEQNRIAAAPYQPTAGARARSLDWSAHMAPIKKLRDGRSTCLG